MKTLITISFLLAMCIPTSQAQSINTLKWKNRILLFMDSSGDLSLCNQQLMAFADFEAAIKERELVLFCYDGKQLVDQKSGVTPYQLTPAIDPAFQGVILLGKDGGIKLQEPFMVKPRTVFELIDSMPMRKAEMKASGDN